MNKSPVEAKKESGAVANLIERLEKATGPDREIDLAIGEAERFEGFPAHCPHYTQSADAALTLVPEGWWLKLRICKNKNAERAYCHAELERDADTMDADIEDHGPLEVSGYNAPNGAIALCIAALKARMTAPPNDAGGPS